MINKKNIIIAVAVVLAIVLSIFLFRRNAVNDVQISTTTVGQSEETTATTVVTEKQTTTTTKSQTTTTAKKQEISKSIEIDKNSEVNEKIQREIIEFIDPVYFNVLFGSKSYEKGITQEDMKLFAISYIYQHEYNELKFDTQKFILYVPEERVEELVKEYFDETVETHSSFLDLDLEIAYDSGYYLMPASDNIWTETMVIDKVEKIGDFSYNIVISFDSPDGALPKKSITLERREGRFIITQYKDIL